MPESEIAYGSWTSLNISNSGVASTCGGSRLPAVNAMSSVTLNRHEKRLTAKAIIDANSRVRITVGMVISTELPK